MNKKRGIEPLFLFCKGSALCNPARGVTPLDPAPYLFHEKVTTVPVFPSNASRHLSKLVMMARRPG